MERADSLLAPIIKKLRIEEAVRLGRLKDVWGKLFERPVSLHMSPASLKQGELLINVDSPLWMQQLNFFRSDIISKLADFGIRNIRLRLGRISPEKEERKTVSRKKPLGEKDYCYIDETVSSVGDEDLRNRIKKAMEKSISFKR